jgi:hypothetical protein
MAKAEALITNTIEIAQAVAQKRKGRCLSEKYVNSYSHLLWECEKRHTWYASLNKVKDVGRWCPQCSGWPRETECRELFEELTGRKFPPMQPSFLLGLKYDGFCSEYGLAFEYNGIQHYEEVPFFHRTPGSFIAQQRRDSLKEQLSYANWVVVLAIPYWVRDLYSFIQQNLHELGLITAA